MTAGDNPKPTEKIDKRRLLLFLLATPLFLALLFFLPAGTWLWERGWLLIGVFYAAVAASTLYLRLVNPDLLAARINRHGGTEPWDKTLLAFLFVTWLAMLPVAALDDARFHWLPVPWWVCILGYAVLLIGFGILTWAQAVNKFFEPTVRIRCRRRGIRPRFGAVGKHGSIAAIERFIGTLKREGLRVLAVVPLLHRSFHREDGMPLARQERRMPPSVPAPVLPRKLSEKEGREGLVRCVNSNLPLDMRNFPKTGGPLPRNARW